MNESLLPALEHLLIQHEGLRLTVYLCPAGHPTIGVGHNLDVGPIYGRLRTELGLPPSWSLEEGLTREQAKLLLRHDLATVWALLEATFPDLFPTLDGVRQCVLVDMAFNMGASGVNGFHHFIQALERQDYEAAAEEMLNSQWAHQVGARATHLASIMRSGQLTNGEHQ